MSLNTFREIINLVPRAQAIVKKADLDKDYSTANKDATLASFLKTEYLTKVAHQTVPPQDFTRVRKAVHLYGLEKEADALSKELLGNYHEKQAQESTSDERLKAAQLYFESQLSGNVDLEKIAHYAEQLYDNYGASITSDEIKRYAGVGYFDKQACIQGLVSRANLTRNPEFVKVAKVVEASKDGSLDEDDVRIICRAITQMDKKANLGFKGYNVYKESVMSKKAELASSLKVDLNGKMVPIESVYNLGQSRLGSMLGDDVAKEVFDSDPQTAKSVLETLPMDMRSVLKGALS